MVNHIREFQINHRKQKLLFERYEKDLKESIGTHDNHPEILMVLLFGQKVWKAYDEWCQEVLVLLNKGKEFGGG
jgi:PadR family transcriptional regulator AphA